MTKEQRLYNWREVESMREHLAALGMQHSSCEAKALRLSARLSKVEGVMEEMRGARLYEWADKLRDALKGESRHD